MGIGIAAVRITLSDLKVKGHFWNPYEVGFFRTVATVNKISTDIAHRFHCDI